MCRNMISGAGMPIRRAACTYSLFCSTRSSRARCGHTAPRSDRPIDSTRTQNAGLLAADARTPPRHAVDQQRDQDRREGELDVGDAHDERVDAAADIAGQQAERDAERGREQRRRQMPTSSDTRVP